MYETILSCPNCGFEQRLVADDVVAERDRLREQLETMRDAVQEYVDALAGFAAGNHDDPQWPEQAFARLRIIAAEAKPQKEEA